MYKKLFVILLTVLLGSALLLGGCGSSTTDESTTDESTTDVSTSDVSTGEPQYGGTLVILTDIDGSGVCGCPWEQNPSNAAVTYPCIDTLITWNFGEGPQPNLAESWDIAEDGTSITFTLRDDVLFHDGTQFDAEALKWNMEKWMENHQAGSGSWTSIEVVDTYTLKLNLNGYQSTVLSGLTEDYLGPISPTAYEANGEEWAQLNPVGTGPFKLTSLDVGVGWTYEANEDYWGGQPYLDGIEYKTVTDWNTMKMMMEAGEADMISAGGAAGAKVISALGNEGFELMSYASGGDPSCLYPDSANADSPFYNKDVRLAVDYAIDREALAALGDGLWDPVWQLGSPKADYFDSSLVREYDTAKAVELLEGAGYADGFTCSVYYEPGTPQDLVVAVQAMLADVGIQLTLEAMTPPVAFETAMGGWTDGLFSMPFPVRDDLVSGMSERFSKSSFLFPSILRTDELEAMIVGGSTAMTTAEAHEYYGDAAKYIFDEVLCMPLFSYARGALGCQATYVHDANWGICNPATWTPELCWMSE